MPKLMTYSIHFERLAATAVYGLRDVALFAIVAIMIVASSLPAAAIEPDKNEKAKLKACERQFCAIVVGRKPAGPHLACKLSKTWSKKTLKKGGKKSRVSWLFGDAKCVSDISMGRPMILRALQPGKYKMKIPRHTVNCQVERSKEVRPVKIVIAPKIQFKNGKAKKIWLNVKKVKGPQDVKGLIWTVAKLEDSLGIFHRPMLKQVNKFLHVKCTKLMKTRATLQAGN